ncbi:MAG: PIG-L deacetylase family protein [bacterium]
MNGRMVPVLILAVLTIGALSTALALSFWHPACVLLPFSLPDQAKVLFILPHPDDEVISAGGIIPELEKRNCQMAFIYLTNGENFEWAAEEESGNTLLTPQQYLKFGYDRQRETGNALQALGLAHPRLTFLGYPDRSLTSLLTLHWSSKNPFFSRQLKTDRTPYTNSFDPQAIFSGECLLEDLEKAIGQTPWDIIFLPSPYDAHPDHWAAAAFARMAIEELRGKWSKSPTLVSYLVHRGDWPGQNGKPSSPLLPPASMRGEGWNWMSFNLTPEDLTLKERALREYKSQLSILSGYLFSFLRPNELFSLDTPLSLQGEAEVKEPAADTFWRTIFKGADFKSLSFSWDNGLKLNITTSGSFPKTFDLNIYILSWRAGKWSPLLVNDAFRNLKKFKGSIVRSGKSIEIFIPLEKPQAFLLTLSSRYWINIDRSSCWLISLP